MRADPRSGKRRENKAGQGVLGLDAHAPDAAQAQDAAGRFSAGEKEVSVQRYRSHKFSGDAVGRDLYPVTLKSGSWKR